MRTLSDTITRLTAQRASWMAATMAGADAPDRLQPLGDFGDNPGALDGFFHVPPGLPAGAPLVVVLHGCTQNAAAYDHHSGWSELADEAGFAVLYAQQRRLNNLNLCFNWFQPDDVTTGSGEVASIRAMIATMVKRYRLDDSRIFVTGLSAGGAMAASMLATYPKLFAGGAVIAGVAHGIAASVPAAFDRMRGHGIPDEAGLQRLLEDASRHRGPWPRLAVWQGTADETVAATNAAAVVAQWRAVHGLAEKPDDTVRRGGVTRQAWKGQGGAPVVELVTIDGMGHGTPLAADGLGTPGPFMLEAGIDSTREIARFFGIAGAAGRRTKAAAAAAAAPAPAAETGPGAVIRKALRAAGLMK